MPVMDKLKAKYGRGTLRCRAYDTEPDLKYQRLSNFRPRFTDEELLTVYLFGHTQGFQQQRRI